MKTKALLPVSCMLLLSLNPYALATAQKTSHVLSENDWNAICSSGSPTAPTGCLGNVSSQAFQTVSNATGGFTTWANIEPRNAPDSVFLKAFLDGTNTPDAPPNIRVNVVEGAARCGLFTKQGASIGNNGINNLNPSPGTSQMQSAPLGLILALNISAGSFTYEQQTTPAEAAPPDPIYVMCVAYDPTDGASAVSTASNITAR